MKTPRAWFLELGKHSPALRLAYRRTALFLGHLRYIAHRPSAINTHLVLFEAFLGRSYAGSPKAMYEAMLSNPKYADYEFVWFFRKPERAVPIAALNTPRTRIVKYKSREYYHLYREAKYWVSNSIIPGPIVPTPNQVYVQTWHGTPLKRIGLDVVDDTESALTSTPEIDLRYRGEGNKVTYFLSSSTFTDAAFATAFALPTSGSRHPLALTGNPRNDVLVNYFESDEATIRQRLNLPEGKRILLYAPTWRDDQHTSGTGYVYRSPIDFHRLHDALGDDWIVLFRAHYLVSSVIDFEAFGDFVRDVSGVQEINDLYIVADMLVTDYSSSFFDYCLLERPMVFFMFDREHYERELRGFYLDPENVPGPIAQTQEELTDWIQRFDVVDQHWSTARKALNATLNPHDDGHAAERAVDLLVNGARPQYVDDAE